MPGIAIRVNSGSVAAYSAVTYRNRACGESLSERLCIVLARSCASCSCANTSFVGKYSVKVLVMRCIESVNATLLFRMNCTRAFERESDSISADCAALDKLRREDASSSRACFASDEAWLLASIRSRRLSFAASDRYFAFAASLSASMSWDSALKRLFSACLTCSIVSACFWAVDVDS